MFLCTRTSAHCGYDDDVEMDKILISTGFQGFKDSGTEPRGFLVTAFYFIICSVLTSIYLVFVHIISIYIHLGTL